jgi:hypothetical protein
VIFLVAVLGHKGLQRPARVRRSDKMAMSYLAIRVRFIQFPQLEN